MTTQEKDGGGEEEHEKDKDKEKEEKEEKEEGDEQRCASVEIYTVPHALPSSL